MARMLGLGFWRIESKGGGDERGEILNIGTHHDDVPRLECGIVGKQADEYLPQNLHLTIGSVTPVELHTPVVVCDEWSRLILMGWPVASNVGLQPAKQRRRLSGLGRLVMHIDGVRADLREGKLKFTYVTAQIGQ
jgi:hypothetical protein